MKLHLFNCDHTYKLDAVQDLLKATKAKQPSLDFDVVEPHYFSLAQMHEMPTTISKLEIDMAFFVVHAHESRLSINEDNAGIGYATIYRALLKATEEKVIIIIGGDDNYKNKDEEDRVVISRWARMKIQSQFKGEFLDGRKSFIFSWNKNHREIHEEALWHYFDPQKEGQKFEYQPKQVVKAAYPSSERAPLPKYQSMDEQRGREGIGSRNSSSAKKRHGKFSFGRSRSADETSSTTGMATLDSDHGGKSKETPSVSADRTRIRDLAILGCNVSETSMQTVKREFEKKLNLAERPLFENLPLDEVKNYLTRRHPKFKICVLVVDALTVKDAYESQRQQHYEELLATAVDEVVAKVLVLVCETRFPPPKDEVIDGIISIVDRIITREKVFVAKLENEKVTINPDVLAQLIVLLSAASHRNPEIHSSTHLDPPQGNQMTNPSESQTGYGCTRETRMQQEQGVTTISSASASSFTGHITSNREPVMLKSQLRNGEISYVPGDLEILSPKFQVPGNITRSLLHVYGDTIQAGVKIVRDSNGELRVTVQPKSKDSSREEAVQIADNETLLLATLVRYGEVSLAKDDLRYRDPDWKIPAYVKTSLARDYGTLPKGELYVISDEKGEITLKVDIERGQKILGSAYKTWKRLKNFKS